MFRTKTDEATKLILGHRIRNYRMKFLLWLVWAAIVLGFYYQQLFHQIATGSLHLNSMTSKNSLRFQLGVHPEPLDLSGSTEPFGLEQLRVERLAEVSGRSQAPAFRPGSREVHYSLSLVFTWKS